MAVYEMEVIETRTIRVMYRVEADGESEATDLAVIGDTVSEEEFPASVEVVNRVVYSSPKKVKRG